MMKFFDDPETITEEKSWTHCVKLYLDMKIVPMVCGSSFKNKGVQTMLGSRDGIDAKSNGQGKC
jgi:elongation factor G